MSYLQWMLQWILIFASLTGELYHLIIALRLFLNSQTFSPIYSSFYVSLSESKAFLFLYCYSSVYRNSSYIKNINLFPTKFCLYLLPVYNMSFTFLCGILNIHTTGIGRGFSPQVMKIFVCIFTLNFYIYIWNPFLHMVFPQRPTITNHSRKDCSFPTIQKRYFWTGFFPGLNCFNFYLAIASSASWVEWIFGSSSFSFL